MTPNQRIKDFRLKTGMSQSEFAEKIRVKWFKIKDTESGRLRVTEELAKKINFAFGVNWEWILTGVGNPEYPLQEDIEVFFTKPVVVGFVKERANGICELCHNPAPFNRASDNSPYLEVHYLIPIDKDGEDTATNLIAVCPNCHRKLHYG